MSAAKKKMAVAQQARWAKRKSTTVETPVQTMARKNAGITAAVKARLAAAMKARWAAMKAAGSDDSAK